METVASSTPKTTGTIGRPQRANRYLPSAAGEKGGHLVWSQGLHALSLIRTLFFDQLPKDGGRSCVDRTARPAVRLQQGDDDGPIR